MKKIYQALIPAFIVFFIFFNENISYGSSVLKPLPNKAIALNGSPIKYLRASEFIKLSARDFSKLTGKKLTLIQRLAFSITKMRMKRDLKKNPGLTITEYLRETKKETSSFNLGWFLIGLIAPLIGLVTAGLAGFIIVGAIPVIIAYATKQDREKIKSAWLGIVVSALIILILAFILVVTISGIE